MNGKWLNIGVARYYKYPDLIEIDNVKIKRYLIKGFSNNLAITESREEKFDEKISSLVKIEKVFQNRIKIYTKGIKQEVFVGKKTTTTTTDINAVFDTDYVKLVPTITNLTESRIQLLKYKLVWNNEELIIEFNKILNKPNIQETKDLGSKIILEKLDQTLLISMIRNGEREIVLPIKSIDEDKIILYGFPEKPYESEAKRID